MRPLLSILLFLHHFLKVAGETTTQNAKTSPMIVQPYGYADKVEIQQPNNVYFSRRIEEDGIVTKKIPFESVVYYKSTEGFASGAMPVPEEVHCLNIITRDNALFIPHLLGYSQDVQNKMHVLTMRDAPGVSLDKYLTTVINDQLPEDAFKYILFQIVMAELFLLNRDIAHGDLQAKNIYINPRTLAIKVTELGLAQHGNPMPVGPSGGLFDHIAPERCDKTAAISGEASEVFSIGVVAYRLLHRGKSPFKNESGKFTTQIEKFACVDCSEETKKVVTSMLDADPDKRIRLTKVKDSEWLAMGSNMLIDSYL
ncbi:MAG: serine/threonine protein kinase [Amphiamblys sp. WSBS2006]|nr:MAG: serine/threonine protein kinase [Amphiamblys sp. WSBS2006]